MKTHEYYRKAMSGYKRPPIIELIEIFADNSGHKDIIVRFRQMPEDEADAWMMAGYCASYDCIPVDLDADLAFKAKQRIILGAAIREMYLDALNDVGYDQKHPCIDQLIQGMLKLKGHTYDMLDDLLVGARKLRNELHFYEVFFDPLNPNEVDAFKKHLDSLFA